MVHTHTTECTRLASPHSQASSAGQQHPGDSAAFIIREDTHKVGVGDELCSVSATLLATAASWSHSINKYSMAGPQADR